MATHLVLRLALWLHKNSVSLRADGPGRRSSNFPPSPSADVSGNFTDHHLLTLTTHMYNYQEIIEDLETTAKIPIGDIFDYQYSPINEIYDRYFQFCQENLTEECDEYDIQPAKFYYRTEYGINARAGIQNGYSIIGVNMQTIHSLYDLFYEKNDIFDTDAYLSENYGDLVSKFDVPVGHLMFQLATLFTYHHELAHLIQKSPNVALWLSEQYADTTKEEFSIERHVLELDADLNAAHSICFHLIEYLKKLPQADRTQDNLQKILSIGVASVFSYFLLYFKDEKKMYYAEHTHPHPLVRISYIVDCFIRVAEINLPQGFKLDLGTTLKEGFIIADTFFLNVFKSSLVEEFGKHFMTESKNIESYVNELLGVAEGMPNLVKNRPKA